MSGHDTSRFVIRILPSVLLLLFIIGYISTAYLTLDTESRRVPLLAAYVACFLLVVDIVAGLSRGRAAKKTSKGSGGRVWRESNPPLAQEASVLLSVIGLVLGIYLAGFYVAVPLYLIVTMRYFGHQSLRFSLTTAFVASLIIYLAFDLALGYRIFPGIILS